LNKETEAIIKRAFDNLEFDSGKDIIRASSLASLNELADLMVKNPKWGLKLAGHTDNSGDDAKNMILSNQRATALKKYLTDRGASADKITVEYYGETRPIADNATPEGRQKNRRVEMTIIFE
jgi:outer membrane protein OmpA-like peptidoglycan-associated protein